MLYLAFRNLFRNLRRTIAIICTVALGAGALFCFQGFINGVLEDYRESTIHSHYGNGQIHTKGYRDMADDKPWDRWIANPDELRTFLQEQPNISAVFPRVTIAGMLMNGKKNITGHGQGIDAQKESSFFTSLNIESGEALTTQPDGILLGKGLAQALNVHPGDTVTLYLKTSSGGINKGKFKVTGIFHTGLVDFDSRVFRIQLAKAQELLKTDSIETVSVGLKNHTNWGDVQTAVENRFPNLETASFAELDKVYYQHSVDWLQAQFHVVQIIILSIVLLGIFNTVSAAIFERKQEIGNLRANGESVQEVMQLIITEGALLGILGCALGLLLSFAIAKGLLDGNILMPPGPGSTRQFFITFSFAWKMTLYTAFVSITSAVAASFLAGLKVAKMPIAQALRAY